MGKVVAEKRWVRITEAELLLALNEIVPSLQDHEYRAINVVYHSDSAYIEHLTFELKQMD